MLFLHPCYAWSSCQSLFPKAGHLSVDIAPVSRVYALLAYSGEHIDFEKLTQCKADFQKIKENSYYISSL